eukprot:SAG31_NODE_9766_length_1230_cov_1.619805_2_plen_68_part_01
MAIIDRFEQMLHFPAAGSGEDFAHVFELRSTQASCDNVASAVAALLISEHKAAGVTTQVATTPSQATV